MVDDLLGPTLYLRVAALHGIKVQRRGVGARGHGTGRTAAHADAHARPAQLHQQRARRKHFLVGLPLGDLPQAASDHDRLVKAAHHPGHGLFEGAEVARQVGPAELVVEGCAAERAFDHDVQRAGDVGRLARAAALPGFVRARQAQVAGGKARQPRLGPGATARGPFIADLATRPGGRTGKGRDGRGVVVGLHLHQHMGRDLARRVRRSGLARSGQPLVDWAAMHHRGVVAVSHHRALWRSGLGVSDHAEHRMRLFHSVDGEAGVEDLVPAVLGVGLRKHHQLHIRGVALQAREGVHQVVNLVVGQREAEVTVGLHQRLPALAQQVHVRHGHARMRVKQSARRLSGARHALGHAVVQQRGQGAHHVVGQRRRPTQQALEQAAGALQAELGDTLHALHWQCAVAGDVGGLAGPG